MQRPSLSALVLAQDAAGFLPRVLANLRPLADEIIVLDGGSSDSTPEIAASEPKARLFYRFFEGDFAAQKNFGIEQCGADWVLVVDADELLSDTLRAQVPALIRSRRARWYKFPRYWVLADENPLRYIQSPLHYPDYQLRLFRNEPAFRYVPGHPVHQRFPREGRGPGKRLRRGHIIHFAFALAGRADRESRVTRYTQQYSASSATNRIYLYEDYPHRVLPCIEKISEELPA
ncbi:MAG TPA: glycosyltransferase family 2 protein [Acidobacteriota bacterium]|jgi:glycosyltransferase involved in cell wall biosynthesis